MSTDEHLRGLAAAGKLVLFTDDDAPARFVRRLWLLKFTWDRLQEGLRDEDPDEQSMWLQLNQTFVDFCEGADFEAGDRLKPMRGVRGVSSRREVWEIRALHAPPARLLGCFLRRGELIGLTAGHKHLYVNNYDIAIERVVRSWDELMNGRRRLIGDRTDMLRVFAP